MCVHILSLWSAAVLKLLQQGVTSLPRFISIHPLVEVDIETKIGLLQFSGRCTQPDHEMGTMKWREHCSSKPSHSSSGVHTLLGSVTYIMPTTSGPMHLQDCSQALGGRSATLPGGAPQGQARDT